jgi:hypothetical protein
MAFFRCSFTNAVTPKRRLEDRIFDLCRTALITEGPELDIVLSDLRDALREHVSRIRKLAATNLLNPPIPELSQKLGGAEKS